MMFATFVLVLATFVLTLMLATFMIAFAFVTFFVLAATFMVFATFVIAFAFVFAFTFAFMLWHVGFHFLHLLSHVDEFCSLIFVKVFPVGESFNHSVHATNHFRAHLRFITVMVAFMMFVALLFLVFAAFFLFVVFLFVAA